MRLVFTLLAITATLVTATTYPRDYSCALCHDQYLAVRSGLSREQACNPLAFCDLAPFHPPMRDETAAEWCVNAGLCPGTEEWELTLAVRGAAPASPIDLRVTPGLANKGKIRLSAISAAVDGGVDDSFFTYSKQFQHRWTQFHLSSALVDAKPGKNHFTIANTSVTVNVPASTDNVAGIIFGDPCFSGAAVGCMFGNTFKTFERMTALLNAAATHDDMDYFMILGDNFYDRYGNVTQKWFDQLTLNVKSKLFATCEGNHDIYAYGAPAVAIANDQYGNGFMQYYGMDSMAAQANPSVPVDTSIDPNKGSSVRTRMPSASNFQSYFAIGNIGFIIYSSAYNESETNPFLTEACAFLNTQKPKAAFVVAHWNSEGTGCEPQMDVELVFARVQSYPGCQEYGQSHTLKYIFGHEHKNKVTVKDTGFMVGGQGMEDTQPSFGVPVVMTTTGSDNLTRLQVLYYPIAAKGDPMPGTYEALLDCFTKTGITGCTQLADVWLNQTIPAI